MFGHLFKWAVNGDLEREDREEDLKRRAIDLIQDAEIDELKGEAREASLRVAREAVRNSLSAPDTAEFSDEAAKESSDNCVAVAGVVASENLRGVVVHNRYVVVLAADRSVTLVVL
jgi:hypothetical protein